MRGAVDRRTFLATGVGLVGSVYAQTARPETLLQWLQVPGTGREAARRSSLDEVRRLDQEIHAWVQVLPQDPVGNGPLAGIPFGVKDVIETRGLATEYGSPLYKGRIGATDAAIVRQLKERGGVLFGKTHTAAFAYTTPPPTRNPRNLAHTPGGSSSGSAAAVAAGMIPMAVGTQTGGSVVRPASFCGVTGFKTSYGLLPMDGVLPLAASLDTLGFFTHTAADMLAYWDALGHSPGRPEDFELATPDPLPDVEPVMATAFKRAIDMLRDAGLTIRSVDIAATLVGLDEARRTVMFFEGARFHEARYKEYGNRLDSLGNLVRDGLQMSTEQYDAARRYIGRCKVEMSEHFKKTPVFLTPAAPGPAPLGLSSTGSARMNAPWTALGTPAITIPMPVGTELPLGLQLIADHGQDARLLRTAVRLERVLRG
jgi:Asp-tRNA(Asn)/Glu-tRNA(Gln) amidotransferase A subunit family amidase